MTDPLQHIRLTTGEITRLACDTVSDEDIADCAELLDGILLGGVLPVPGADGYVISGSHYRDDLKVTFWMTRASRRIPVLTIGVARGPASGVALWREMHRSAKVPLATDTTSPPAEPWIADRPEPDAIRNPETASRLGDWLQRLGRTWMEYGR